MCGEGFECLPSGDLCATPEQCCGGICAPDANGVLHCRESCIPSAGACTTDADCCDRFCGQDGTCGPPQVDCIPLGAACTESAECCYGTCSARGFCQILVR
jgi:hypothetical protein